MTNTAKRQKRLVCCTGPSINQWHHLSLCKHMASPPSPEPPRTVVRRAVHARRPNLDGSLSSLFRSGALAARAHEEGCSTSFLDGSCTELEPVSTSGNGS